MAEKHPTHSHSAIIESEATTHVFGLCDRSKHKPTNTMKKLIIPFLAVITLSFAACDSNKGGSGTSDTGTSGTTGGAGTTGSGATGSGSGTGGGAGSSGSGTTSSGGTGGGAGGSAGAGGR
jgi:hypothetical protein